MESDDAVERNSRGNRRQRPLRVLWLIDSLTVGGAEALTVVFAREASRRGIELTVCARTTIEGNVLERELRSAACAIENLDARNLRDVRAFRRLLAIIRERQVDIVHAHLTYAAIWASLASRVTGVPAVATLHVSPPRGAGIREALRQRLMRFVLNRYASRVALVSDAIRSEYVAAGLAPKKAVTVHNGIEIAPPGTSTEATRRELGTGDDERLIAAVAVLREGKGIDVLLRAFASIAPAEKGARLVIVGDGPKRQEWEALARSLNLGTRVIWTGYRRDVGSILEASSLFVHPTEADAFPTVVLEAMAARLPVIASRVGGVPEIVVDGSTGSLVGPGDADALALALTRALSDPAWMRAAGSAGRSRVERLFTTEAWTDRLEALYASVLGDEGRAE